jgi:uncharacterized membrane protein (DUF2068 family)
VNNPLLKWLSSRGDTAALRSIAVYEVAKATLVVAAGVASLFLLRHDLQGDALHALRHLHIDPASRVALEVLHMALRLQAFDPRWIILGSLAYALVRCAESYGLWYGRAWGEWIGALSGAIYFPFEIHELYVRITALRVGVLLANLVIVGFLCWHLWHRRRVARKSGGAPILAAPPGSAETVREPT